MAAEHGRSPSQTKAAKAQQPRKQRPTASQKPGQRNGRAAKKGSRPVTGGHDPSGAAQRLRGSGSMKPVGQPPMTREARDAARAAILRLVRARYPGQRIAFRPVEASDLGSGAALAGKVRVRLSAPEDERAAIDRESAA